MNRLSCCTFLPCFPRLFGPRLLALAVMMWHLGAFAQVQIPVSVWDSFVANSDGSWYEFDVNTANLPQGYVDPAVVQQKFNATDAFIGLRYKNTRFKYEANVPEVGMPGMLMFTPTGAANKNYQERVAIPKTKDQDYDPAREVAVRMDYFLVNNGPKTGNLETDLRTYHPEPHVKRNGLSTYLDQPGPGTNPVPDGQGAEFVLLSQYGPDTYQNNFPKGNKGDVYGQTLPQGFTTFDLTGQYETFNPNSTTYTQDRTVFAVGLYAHDVTDYDYQSQIYPCYPGTNIRLTVPSNQLIQNRFLIGLNTVTNGQSNKDGYFRWWMRIPSINNGQWFLAASLNNRDFTGDVAMQLANLGIGQYNGGNGKGYYLDDGTIGNGIWFQNMSAYYRNGSGGGSGPANTPPQVSLTSPQSGAKFNLGVPITFTANASDPGGSVAKVEFLMNGTTVIGTDNTAPYSVSWTPGGAANYTISARATDNQGLSTTSTVIAVSVTSTNTPPQITLNSPLNSAKVNLGTPVTITATASDPGGSITKVDFLMNGVSVIGSDNTAPYTMTWTPGSVGTYNISARATDNTGLTTTTTTAAVTVLVPSAQAPVVNFTSPANGASYQAGANVAMTATASDPDGSVVKVEFYQGNTLLGSDATSPYQFTWNAPPAGNYSLKAVAIDNAGLKTTSSVVAISVKSNQPQAPVVSVTSPAANTTFKVGDKVTIQVSATDPDGSIVQVRFFAGTTQLAFDNVAPYSYVWTVTTAGTYAISAAATDNGGQIATSAPVSIVVTPATTGGGGSGNTGTTKPTIQIIRPLNGSSYAAGSNIDGEAIASDPNGKIELVEFYMNGAKFRTEKVAPYTAPLLNVQPGSYSLMAICTDNTGDKDTAVVQYTVTGGAASNKPTVDIIKPLDGAKFNVGATVAVEAKASDTGGSITQVEFYLNGQKWRTEKVAPYTGTLSNVQAGSYVLMAIAYDNDGFRDTSIVNYTVGTGASNPQAPLVAIVTPITGSEYAEGATVEVLVNATDPDGSISKVDIFRDATLIQTEKVAPYTAKWSNAQPGVYTLRAIAYDNSGLSTSSAIVTVIVKGSKTPAVIGLTLDATPDQGLVVLNWGAQQEILVDQYRLSRSGDSVLYQAITDVAAVGTSPVPTTYDEIDLSPLAGAVAWYKLEAVAADGTILDTKVVKLDLSEPKVVEKWIIFPNPLSGDQPIQIWALLTQNVEVAVEIADVYGKVIHATTSLFSIGQNNLSVGLDSLSPGMYFFTLRNKQSGDVLDTKMFIKTP